MIEDIETLQTTINKINEENDKLKMKIDKLTLKISKIENSPNFIKYTEDYENNIRIPYKEFTKWNNNNWKLYYKNKDLKNYSSTLEKNNIRLIQLNKTLDEKLEQKGIRKKLKKFLKKKNYNNNLLKKIEKKLNIYQPRIKLLDKQLKYRDNRLIELKFTENKKDQNQIYTKENIQEISNNLSHYLSDKEVQGEMITTIFYDDAGWKSGHIGNLGEDIQLYDPQQIYTDGYIEDQDTFSKFLIYLIIKPNAEGGNSHNNDCLFECLEFYLHDRNPWANGATLKKYLGLKRNDKIPLSLIPKVEEKLKSFQINIIGDYIYSSQVKSNKIISLVLQDEHYSINRNVDNNKVKNLNINYKEKKIMLFDKVKYIGYDGNEIIKFATKKEFKDCEYHSEYIIVNREYNNNKMTIQEEYNELIETANILKRETKGIINLYKTGDYKNTALNLFDRFTKFILNPENILQDEFIWLRNATMGAIIFSEKYEGPAYKHDVKSMYPSIYLSSGKFPVKRGEFRTLTTQEFNEMKFYQFGVYRCKIYESEDKNINKLFKFNKLNYYTQISLEHAKSLNLRIELIEDDKPNNLYYEREKLIGFNEVFTEYTNFLFDLKEKKVPKAKLLLNIIWGALTQLKKSNYIVRNDKQTNIKEFDKIISIFPDKYNEDILIIKTINQNDIYVSNFGRIQPFILSRGRFMISDIMKPIKETIKRVHTDGFISTTNDNLIHGNKIGDLVYEGYCEDCKIINCNSVIGEFK